jgi:hypothetical protein
LLELCQAIDIFCVEQFVQAIAIREIDHRVCEQPNRFKHNRSKDKNLQICRFFLLSARTFDSDPNEEILLEPLLNLANGNFLFKTKQSAVIILYV